MQRFDGGCKGSGWVLVSTMVGPVSVEVVLDPRTL